MFPDYRWLYRLCIVLFLCIGAFSPTDLSGFQNLTGLDPTNLFENSGSEAPATDRLRIVNEAGQPLVNAPLRLLCYAEANSTTPFADLLLETDVAGYPQQSLPSTCVYAAVLQILHKQPSGKAEHEDAYWVYNTSWEPGTRQLHPTSGDLAIHAAWRLVLFDVAVTLEWTPPPGDSYAADLQAGFGAASAYLYDLTDGQMAFGPFTLNRGGLGWNGADVRVRAANDYRPTAQVGGIVAQPIRYITPADQHPIFAPGAIWLGRYWNGFDAADPLSGAWSQPPAYQTLVHEWLHYALFLYDEYQQIDGKRRTEAYCTCRDLPAVQSFPDPTICGGVTSALAASALAYHYTASELWGSGAPIPCITTEQYFVHGENDWATLARWSAIQGLSSEWLRPPAQVNAGPELGLAADLFGRRPQPAPPLHYNFLPLIYRQQSAFIHFQPGYAKVSTVLTATTNLTLTLTISPPLSLPALKSLHPQLFVGESPPLPPSPTRLVPQGTTSGPRTPGADLGKALLLGVPPDSQLYATAELYGQPEQARGRFGGSLNPLPAGDATLTLTPDLWLASLDVTPGLEGPLLRALTITLTSRTPLTVTPVATLCTPDTGCPQDEAHRRPLQQSSAITWTTTFTAAPAAELPAYTVLSIEAPGVGQLTRWLQNYSGVGPAHMDQHAPLRDGLLMVDATQPLTQNNSRVLVMPAASLDAVTAPLPPGVGGIVGQPLDLDIHLTGVPVTPGADRALPSPVILTLFYSQAALERLDITPAHLLLLHYQRSSNRWQVAPLSGNSTPGPILLATPTPLQASQQQVAGSVALNWLATDPVDEDGIYAIGYAQTPNFGRTAQKFGDPGPARPGEPIRYLITLPAAVTATLPSDAFIGDQLPPTVQLVAGPTCNQGECHYEPAVRSIQWQGQLAPGDLVVLEYSLRVNPNLPPSACPPQLVNQAVAFDGTNQHRLSATTQIVCPP